MRKFILVAVLVLLGSIATVPAARADSPMDWLFGLFGFGGGHFSPDDCGTGDGTCGEAD